MKPVQVNIPEKNQIVQYLVNDHLKNPLKKLVPEIKIQTDHLMDTDKANDDLTDKDCMDDTSIDEMIPKHKDDTSRPTTIIEVLRIADNLLGTIANLQTHVNQLTTYTESREETKKHDRQIIKNLEARLSNLEKRQESMGQGDIVTFTTTYEKAEELKHKRSQIRKQTALHDRKHLNAYRRFGSRSPSFNDIENQTEPYSSIAAKNSNQ